MGKPPARGTIYLLHFEAPLAHAKHYLGWTKDLDARIEAHRSGQGARILQVLAERGIGFRLVRTWASATRDDERKLKRQGNGAAHCPECVEAYRKRKTAQRQKQRRERRARACSEA